MRNLFEFPRFKSIIACLTFLSFLLISYEIHGQRGPEKGSEIGRDGPFIAYNNGTVLDIRTGLMWAAKDNGYDIDWPGAKSYCENYRGGGYTDWRMPTQEELAGLYDKSKSYTAKQRDYSVHLTELIELGTCCPWASDFRGSEAASFGFRHGSRHWGPTSVSRIGSRAIPVRSNK